MKDFSREILLYSTQIYKLAQAVEPVFCYDYKGSNIAQAIEDLFERKINPYNPILVNSGTNAFYASLLALELDKHSEVIMPINCCQSLVNVVITAGLMPIFVDVNENLCMDMNDLQRKVTSNCKVVLAVHPYGYPMCLDSLSQLCKSKGIILIEDCAQAPLSEIQNKRVGTTGTLAIYSFGQNKPISAGGGGMVCCKDNHLSKSIRIIAREGAEFYPDFTALGFCMSVNELHALYIFYWLNNLDSFVAIKREKNNLYQKQFVHNIPFLGEDLINRGDASLLMHKFVINTQVENRVELMALVNRILVHCGSKMSRLIQPELSVMPFELPFVKKYYLENDRKDLLIESNTQFPMFHDSLQRYLYLSTNHLMDLSEIDMIAFNILHEIKGV